MSDATPFKPDRTQQRFRRLRIGVSVVVGLATVALCALWVRSYRQADQFHFSWTGGSAGVIASKSGRIVVVCYRSGKHPWDAGLYTHSADDERSFPVGGPGQYEAAIGFGILRRPRYAVPPPPSSLQLPVPGFARLQQVLHRTATRVMTRALPGAGVMLPYWSVVAPLAAVVCALTFRRPLNWRISLRTLLVVTTVLAIVMGLVTQLSR